MIVAVNDYVNKFSCFGNYIFCFSRACHEWYINACLDWFLCDTVRNQIQVMNLVIITIETVQF